MEEEAEAGVGGEQLRRPNDTPSRRLSSQVPVCSAVGDTSIPACVASHRSRFEAAHRVQ